MFAYWLLNEGFMIDNWVGTTTNGFTEQQKDQAANVQGIARIVSPVPSKTGLFALDLTTFSFLKV